MNEFEEFAKQFRARAQARLLEFEKVLQEATRQVPNDRLRSQPRQLSEQPPGQETSLRRRGPVKSVLRESRWE
ncbi:hypothetical protein GP475_02670 [Corynebacterium poyangense]|uniref:Uncharacterized protein n=1 Tax=Corynebacterium poyangense TaxID=2684405 RepID=A0A7H0SM90_9CORY|nr:hypothetical protein [Corynebacterium poyangense]MBZ8176765.1 hypothetical protein [Corynebacterium poyangense]QNQ89665.1 hypothetical protein GP475_02670 [Corynebacterium poyangense]